MSLSNKHVVDVCLCYFAKEQCRYLDSGDDGKYYCLKQSPSDKKTVDRKLKETLEEYIKDGGDINDLELPIGNNCKGYPILKHVEQGYDVK